MKVRTRAVAALAAAGALAAGVVGCGDDGQSTASAQQPGQAAQQQSGTAQNAPQQQGTPPGLSTLASALGVSEAKLQSAMESTRPTDPSSGPPSASEMATDLAKALNLDVDKVTAALQDSMPSGGAPPSGQQPQQQAPATSGSTTSS